MFIFVPVCFEHSYQRCVKDFQVAFFAFPVMLYERKNAYMGLCIVIFRIAERMVNIFGADVFVYSYHTVLVLLQRGDVIAAARQGSAVGNQRLFQIAYWSSHASASSLSLKILISIPRSGCSASS